MSTDPSLEPLLAPISEASPGGTSLRYDRTYDLIREARREDDPSLPQGDWARKLKIADFAQVERLCTEALAQRSKDLRIASWLAEAWARTAGLAGIARGLRLFAALLERFWDTAFPPLDEDGVEARSSLVDWMDEALAVAARRAPVTPPGQVAITFEDWERVERGLPVTRPEDFDGPVTPEALKARLSMLGEMRWRTLRAAAEDAASATRELESAASAKMGQAPALIRLREVLSGISTLSRNITGDTEMATPAAPPPVAPAAPHDAEEAPAEGSPGDAPAQAKGPIRNRTEAYLRLSEAADFLMRTEPHSPVPYLVKRAVGWGNLSLAELLVELVGTPDDLVAIQRLLGMRGKE